MTTTKLLEQVYMEYYNQYGENKTDDEEQIIKYARWVYHECDSPISEIEWLVKQILDTNNDKKEIIQDFTENVNELLNN